MNCSSCLLAAGLVGFALLAYACSGDVAGGTAPLDGDCEYGCEIGHTDDSTTTSTKTSTTTSSITTASQGGTAGTGGAGGSAGAGGQGG